MIRVQGVSRRYGKQTAVDDVSFEISRGELVGLLGHNGAGKTTIMRMLTGYLEPSEGEICIDGGNPSSAPDAVQRTLGYLPENSPVYPDMRVVDYLDYAATTKGIAPAERTQAIREALIATELMDRAVDPIKALSRGLRQRVGVAQAIMGNPSLLILDEPTNGLDPEQTDHMRALLQGLARKATIILSTHIMQEVEAVCDRVLVLRNGQLALDSPMDKLRTVTTLHLRIDAATQDMANALLALAEVTQIAKLEEADGIEGFELHLDPAADVRNVCAAVARVVIDNNAQLHGLQPVKQSLDNIFRQVNRSGD